MKLKSKGCSQLTNIPKVECKEIPTIYELANTISIHDGNFHMNVLDIIEKRKYSIQLFKFNKSKHFKHFK